MVWWYTTLIPALERQKQETLFGASPVYIVNSRPSRARWNGETLSQKIKWILASFKMEMSFIL